MKVLVVEDDADIARSVVRFLREAGYVVDVADTCSGAEDYVLANNYDALVFDRSLPDGDGLNILRFARDNDNHTPALFLTALDSIDSRVEGLGAGADDYLVKPFAMPELVARVHALTRRRSVQSQPVLSFSDIRLNPATLSVLRADIELRLTTKEFAILHYVFANPDRVVTRSELIEHCWDELSDPMSNVVDVKVAQLRKKLGQPAVLHTVRGSGYVLRET